jgi:hypothetical protein
MRKKQPLNRIVKEYKDATRQEIWEGVRDNFIWGFLASIIIVFVSMKADIAVLLSYIVYYMFLSRIINRPKYITDLGKLVVFPLPSAIGAFVGYKLSSYILTLI